MGYRAASRGEGAEHVQAAVLVEPDRLETIEVAEPTERDGHALIRVRSVGVCGTDVKIAAGAIPVDYPRILGHEMVGEVVSSLPAAGDGSGPAVGDRVLVDPGIVCGACRQCGEGRENICTRGALLGRDRDGGLRILMPVPVGNLHQLREVPLESGALLQVLATCIHAQRLLVVFPGDAVVVLGLGVTGLLQVQLAKRRGAWPVVGVTRSEEKLAIARSLGADVTIRADGPDNDGASVLERIREETDGGADLVIEAVGSVPTLAQAIEAARVGGRVLAYGTIPRPSGDLPFYELYRKELIVVSPRSANAEDFPLAIDAVASGHVRIDTLVTHRFPLAETRAAVATAAESASLKVLVDV